MGDELLNLLKEDQENIRKYNSQEISLSEYQKQSEDISERFTDWLRIHGFPFLDKNPSDVYRAAVTLALHLPSSELMKIADSFVKAEPPHIESEHKAYFVDKTNVLQGRKQVYGTQYKKDSQGNIVFLPIDDEKNVDAKRNQIGLCSLAECVEYIQGKRSSVTK